MEEKETRLIWRTSSIKALEDIYFYIAESNPENAANFIERMILFGESLTILPTKYGICRFKKYAQRNRGGRNSADCHVH